MVLVGDDPASQVYVRNKDRAATEAGFAVRTVKLGADVSQSALEDEVRALSQDESVHGILVQLPLPRGLDKDAALDCIDPAKDVDGLLPQTSRRWSSGSPGCGPARPRAASRSSIATTSRSRASTS